MRAAKHLAGTSAALFLDSVVAAGLLEAAVTLLFGEQSRLPRHAVGASFGRIAEERLLV